MALRAQSNGKGRVREGVRGGLSGVLGSLVGQVFGGATLRGGLTNSLKGSVSAGAVLAGGLSLKRALAGNVAGGATFTSALTGGGASMPAGASAIFYMDQYAKPAASGSTYVVPNSAPGYSAPSANLLPFPRRVFGGGAWWVQSNLTITDANAIAPDGTMSASTITGTNWFFAPQSNGVVLPAGTYILAVDLRWQGTGSPSFRFGPNLTVITAADQLWHRYFVQFTANGSSGPGLGMFSPDSTTPGAWEVRDYNLFSGSTDLGPVGSGDDGHLYFTSANAGTKYTLSGGAVQFGGVSVYSGFSLPATQTISAFTLTYLAARTATGLMSLLSVMKPSSHEEIEIGPNFGGPPEVKLNGIGFNTESSADLYFPNGSGFTSNAVSYDGSYVRTYKDGIQLGAFPASATSVALRDFFVGMTQNGIQMHGNLHAMAFYPTALTLAQVRAVDSVFKARAAAASITVSQASKFVCFEGDSITYRTGDNDGDGAGGYAIRTRATVGLSMTGGVAAQGGSTVTGTGGLTSRAALVDGLIPADKQGVKYVLHIFIGTNDLNGNAGTLANYLSALQSYITARRAAGWDKIILATNIDRGSYGATQAQSAADRISANTTIRSWLANGQSYSVDAISDFAANSNFTPSSTGANAANTTYYGDTVHPTPAGHAILATIAAAAISSI